MILDSAGQFSDAQQFVAVAAGNIQSTNWVDLGQHTDALGVTTYRDIATGEPLYVHFRVTAAFSGTNADNTFRAVVFSDSSDPPLSTNVGLASYIPGSQEFPNTLGVALALSLRVGAVFSLPIAPIEGGAVNPNNTLISRSIGQRFLRVAYQIGGTGTVSGAISATLGTQSSMAGAPYGASNYVGGIYPATVDPGV